MSERSRPMPRPSPAAVTSHGVAQPRTWTVLETLVSRVAGIRLSIAAKLAAVMSALSVATVIAITAFMYNGTIEVLVSEELQRLEGGVDAAAARWRAGFEFYRQDVVFLSKVPPIAGIDRAVNSRGQDPADGSPVAEWKSRLETIFTALLQSHPEYVQVRFVGAGNGGPEIVRVERSADGTIRRTPEGDLQDKADRPYHAGTLRLDAGEVFLSKIDLNEEFGKLEIPHRPVVRVATKAMDTAGKLLGIIVINISMNDLANTLRSTIQPSINYITDEAGDFLYHPDESKTYGQILGRRYTLQDEFPELSGVSGSADWSFAGTIKATPDDMLAVTKRVYFDPVNPDRFISLTDMSPLFGLANKIAAVRSGTIALAALILLVELAAVIWVSLLLTRPVRDLTSAARTVAAGGRDINLTRLTPRSDETGELARAFDVMVGSIADKERELDQRAEELTRSNLELSQFAYIASHDLQEPLRMVSSFLTLLQRRYAEQLNEEANEFIGFAVDGAGRMKVLISDLLGYSRISNSPLHLSRVELSETVDGIVTLLRDRIEQSNAKLTYHDLPAVNADSGQMERLFRNLIDNALKYRAEPAPEIDISAVRQGAFWAFSIVDNGIGIDPKYAEKVFAIFSRLHSRDKYQGTGIGLAACKRIVERHGGKISVSSNGSSGSIFRFTLSALLTDMETSDGQ